MPRKSALPREHVVPAALIALQSPGKNHRSRRRGVAASYLGHEVRWMRAENIAWRRQFSPGDLETQFQIIEGRFFEWAAPQLIAGEQLRPEVVADVLTPFLASLLARDPRRKRKQRRADFSKWRARLATASWRFSRSPAPLLIGVPCVIRERGRMRFAVGPIVVAAEYEGSDFDGQVIDELTIDEAEAYNREVVARAPRFIAAGSTDAVKRYLADFRAARETRDLSGHRSRETSASRGGTPDSV